MRWSSQIYYSNGVLRLYKVNNKVQVLNFTEENYLDNIVKAQPSTAMS